MAHKTAIALDFQALNLDNIINALKGINTLTGKIELPKNVINQINDLTTAVEAMKASTATLGKTKLDSKEFKEFSKNITQSFNELDQRVTLLEQAMVKIGQKQDVSGIVKSLTEIKNNANDATVAIKNMNEIIATPKTLSNNQNSLKSLKEEREILREIKGLQDRDSIEGTISSSKISKMNSKSIIKSLREQIETVQELQMDLDELRESNSSNIEIRAKADQIVSIIATIDRLQERYEKLNGELSLQDIDLYPEIKGGSNIGDIIVEIENSFSEFNKAISDQIDDITSKINSLPKTIDKTKQEIKESAKDTTSIVENFDISNTKYSKQNKKQITIPLHIQAGASDTLRKEIDIILDSIQEDIKPLEVRVALVSGYKTKKNEELAAQLQEYLANIDDQKIKNKLSGLIDTLKKQFETKLNLDIEVEGGERASKIVKDTIKGLKEDLIGGLPPIDIDAQFNEKTLLKLKKQLSTIKFQPIKIDVSKDGETTKKEVTPIAALKTLIDKVKKAVDEKSSAFEEEAKIVNESVTFELQRLQKLYEALMTIYRTLDKIDNSFDLASVATDEFVTRGLIRLQRFYEAIVTIKRNLEDISKISLDFNGIKIGIDKDNLNKLFETFNVDTLLEPLENNNIKLNIDTKSANKKIDNLAKKIKELGETVKINVDADSENALFSLSSQNAQEEFKEISEASSSIELLNNLNEGIQLAKELENTFLDVSEAEEKMVLSGDIGDSAGFLSPKDMQKELAIAEKLSKEEQETNQYINKSQDELQQCLQSEERWLAKCKEGSKAYERRKKNIEEINVLLHSSKSFTENVDTKAEESSEGLEKESNKLSDIYEEAQKAAKAKEEFAKANAEVLQSIKNSLKGLDEESNAFKNLNTLLKLINSLSGKGSDTKIEKLAENLNNISKAFKSLNIKDSKILTQIDNLLQKGDELKVLSDILKNNQKAISAAEKAVSKSQTEEKNKKEAASYLTSYRDEIEKNWKEMVDSNQWTVLSQQIEPFKDGLIHITALVKELDGTYKELTYTTETGEIFDLQKSKEDAVAMQKKADAYERYQQIIANTIEGAQNIGEITEISPDNEAWQKLVELMQRFGIEAKDAVKILRQVDEVGHESFQVFDSFGNKKTIGVSSKDFLAIKTTVKDVNNEFDKLEKGLESLRNLSGKSFDFTNEEAGKLKNTFIQIADAIKNIQETPLNSDLSTKYLKDVERYQNILEDFNKNWFKENKLKTTNPQIVQQYHELKDELSSIISQMKSESFDFPSQSSIDKMNKFSQKARDFYSEIEARNQKMTSANVVEKKFAGKIADTLTRNSAMSKELREQFEALEKQVKETAAQFDGMLPVDKFNEFTLAFQKLDTEMKRTGQTGLSFWDLVGKKIKGISASLIAQYFSLMDVVRYVRQAATTIHELDTALVDLKKTTTMNNADLEEFYKNSSNIAKQMGVTTAEIINQASAWSRLGFSSKEASETMAQLSSQFASISPGMSTEEAQTGLVSLIKAWDIDVKNVERELMDNINTLGNKFALTNKDIIEGMERAGATLSVIGTSVQDSFALFTGAQEVIQNAESVGTALKTLSLRIRGYDEETEELSDDVVAATGKVADLTKVASNNFAGVSLWADAAQTQYRSLKDYLGDIAKIWDEIDASSQTKLLENLFGKRGASVGSSILQNFDQVEKAIEEMAGAAGAADAEMEIIRESWDYKLNNLRETWTGIFQSLIDRGAISDLIDLLTNLSEAINAIVDSSAGLPAIIGTITGLITTIRGQGVLDKSSILRNNDGTIGGINLWGLGNFGSRDARAGVGAFSQAEVNIVQQLGDALQNTTDNGKAYNDLINQLTPNTKKYVNEQLAAGKATNDIAIAMSAGTVKANAMTVATKALNFALSTLGVFAATWAIGKILQGLDYLIHYEEKVTEKANDARNAISQLTDNLNKNISTINNSKERYAELAQSVGNLGTAFQNQGNLSTDEYKEFLDISNELADLYPNLVKGYDSNDNAILNLSGSVNTIVGSLDNLIERQKDLKNSEIWSKSSDIWDGLKITLEKNEKSIKSFESDIKLYQEAYGKLLNGNFKIENNDVNSQAMVKHLSSIFDRAGLNLGDYRTSGAYDSYFNFASLVDEDRKNIKNAFDALISETNNSINRTKDSLVGSFSETHDLIFAWLETESAEYKKIGATFGETGQQIIQEMLNSMDYSTLAKHINDDTINEFVGDLSRTYLEPLLSVTEEMQGKIIQVITGSLTGKELDTAYNEILDYLLKQPGIDSNNPLVIHLTTQFAKGNEERHGLFNHILGKELEKFGPYNARAKQEYSEYFNDFFEYVMENGLTDRLMDIEIDFTGLDTNEAKLEYLYDLIENLPEEKDIKINIRTAESAVDSLADFESAVSSLSDLWWQTVEKNPNASEDDLLGWGFADPAKINSVEQAFSKLIQTVEDKDAQERLGASLRDLEETLVRFPNDSDKARTSINNLINAYLNETDILDDLTEENKEYYIARLKILQIDNAENVVESRLTDTTKNTTKAVKELRDAYNEYYAVLKNGNLSDLDDQDTIEKLVDKVQEAISYFNKDGKSLTSVFKIDEKFVNDHWDTVQRMMQGDEDALRELQKYAAKMQFTTTLDVTLPQEAVDATFNQIWDLIDETNLMDIEVGADLDINNFIAKLNELVGDSWEAASKIQSYFKSALGVELELNRNYIQTGASGAPTEALKYMNKAQGGAFKGGKKTYGSDLGDKPTYTPKPTTSSGGGGGSSAADQGKSDADEYMDAYNKELEALKFLRDQNYLTEAEYLEKFRDLYQKYFGDLTKYAKEYYEAEKEYYEQKIALQQKAINAAIKILDRQIKQQEKLRDEEKKEYEEQKKRNEKKIKELEKINKQYDKQIKILQKEQKAIRKQNIEPLEEEVKSRQKIIDQMNEEIEAIEKANEKRQDEINLQKAAYELERQKHQRTQLVYTEDTGSGQMRYRANPNAVKDAQEAYDNAVYEHRLKVKRDEVQVVQDEIDALQKQIEQYEEQIEEIDKKIELIEEEKEKISEQIEKYQEENELLDEQISKIEEKYQKEIDKIEEYKQKWQELLEIQEQVESLEVLSSFNIDISSLENLDLSVFDNFKNAYIDTVSALYEINKQYANAFNEALDQGLILNTEKMGGLEQAAEQLRGTLSNLDGGDSSSEGSSGSGGSSGGGTSISTLSSKIDESNDKTQILDNTVNNTAQDAKDGINDVHTAEEDLYNSGNKHLDFMEKRIQDDFAKVNLHMNNTKDSTGELGTRLESCSTTLKDMASDSEKLLSNLQKASQLKVPSVSGNSISNNSVDKQANGTVGNAFSSGIGYPGLDHSEVALRSEYGQPELTVYPNGKYELTTQPTMSKLPKDTVIFNEEQTRRILKNGKKGNAYASGTTLSLEEAMPDKATLFNKFESNLTNNMSSIQSSLDMISKNVSEINSNIGKQVTNNNVGMSYVNNGDIHITCPGVTSQEVLDSITTQLNATFFGMATNSYQRAMKR